MREYEADLVRIARVSRILAVGFWCLAVAGAAALGYVLLYWLPQHHM